MKGYQRLGIALRKQGKHFESVKALENGVSKNPESADLKKSLDDAKARLTKWLSWSMASATLERQEPGSFCGKGHRGMQKDFVVQQPAGQLSTN